MNKTLERTKSMTPKILVGYDGSEGAKAALLRTVVLAKMMGAEVQALWVRDSLPHYPETVDEVAAEKESSDAFFNKIKQQAQSLLKEQAVPVRFISRAGNPAHVIIEHAKETDVDLIAVGAAGHSGLWRHLLGHTADRVSKNAPCSVLIVREPKPV